jgi:hypothetical protein
MRHVTLLLGSLRRSLRSRSALLFENLALRRQLAVYQRRGARPRLRAGDRRFWSLLARTWPDCRSPLLLVQPETVIRASHRVAAILGLEEPQNNGLVARELTRRCAS